MPQFSPGESKTAKVVMKNPTSKAFSYNASLILGLPEVAKSEKAFSIPAGGELEVNFPVTMPSTPGEYLVFLSVFSGGVSIGLYQSMENVVIVAPILPFTFGTFSATRKTCPSATAFGIAELSCAIKNSNALPVTRNVAVMWARYSKTYGQWLSCAGQLVPTRANCVCDTSPCLINPFSLTLNPGQTFSFFYKGWCQMDPEWAPCSPLLFANYNYYFWLEDDTGAKSNEVMIST